MTFLAHTTATTGLLLVFTGHGKGKTTAALGTGLRALGQGLNVSLVQFLKGRDECGEHRATREFSLPWTIYQPGRPGFVRRTNPGTDHREALNTAWNQAATCLADPEIDLVILDEINLVAARGWISLPELLQALAYRPAHQHAICTGRDAPPGLCEQANTVTRFSPEKHHLEQGILAQPGIEF